MSPETGRNLIVDPGYWYALFDPRDSLSREAQRKAHYIETLRVLLPWPLLYETLRTRFVKLPVRMSTFDRVLKRPNVEYVDDAPYRDRALAATIRGGISGKRPLSLCDMLIRLLIDDTSLRIRALLTFNPRDFHDVCQKRNVQIL
jgi:hypothetical protein